MDTWTSAMLWAYLWATRCAHAMGKPSLAYAVDAGQLSPFNRRLVRREASKTGLIITRSEAAADRLRAFGVTAPLEVTADNAFTFRTESADEGLVATGLARGRLRPRGPGGGRFPPLARGHAPLGSPQRTVTNGPITSPAPGRAAAPAKPWPDTYAALADGDHRGTR